MQNVENDGLAFPAIARSDDGAGSTPPYRPSIRRTRPEWRLGSPAPRVSRATDASLLMAIGTFNCGLPSEEKLLQTSVPHPQEEAHLESQARDLIGGDP